MQNVASPCCSLTGDKVKVAISKERREQHKILFFQLCSPGAFQLVQVLFQPLLPHSRSFINNRGPQSWIHDFIRSASCFCGFHHYDKRSI